MSIRLLIVDDVPDVRLAIARSAQRDGRLEVVGQAGDGVAGVDAARRLQPDAVVVDQSMPRMSGLEALPILRALLPAAGIVLFSAESSVSLARRALQAGADAHVGKDDGLSTLLDAVAAEVGRRRAAMRNRLIDLTSQAEHPVL